MSGLTALVDTLLATRLAQRVDLVPLKSAVEIAGPEAAPPVEEVNNDMRLPSRAALQRQVGVGLLPRGAADSGGKPATTGEHVTLSLAARAVSAVLELESGATAKVTSAEPLWPRPGPPLAPQLAATLAGTVSNSGLFYESHLQQFAAGTRTLAQLAQEPQARLVATSATPAAPITPATALPASPLEAVAARMADAFTPLPAGAAPPDAAAARANVGTNAGAAPGVESYKAGFGASPSADLTAGADAASSTTGNERASLSAQGLSPVRHAAGQELSESGPDAPATDAPRGNSPSLAGIHHDAVGLVRQQLELLALPVFRWAGEAWPGTRMDWEIQQDPDERPAPADKEAPPRSWSTRLALTLPALRDVEVRLSLAGNSLQVQLAARENTTLALLSEARHELPQRLGELGLQLKGLQIDALPTAQAPAAAPRDDDGRDPHA